MKKVALILTLLISGAFVFGQDEPKTDRPGNNELQDFIKKYNQEEHKYKLYPGDNYRDLLQEFNKKFNTDSTLTEQYPGASRYYARRPVFAPYSGFILEPDTSVKYYLIIKDPLRNTVRK